MIEPLTVTCEPQTLWPLDESNRLAAVHSLLVENAKLFEAAAHSDDAGMAQDMGIAALSAIAGLFPKFEDGVQSMLLSLVGMIVAAKAGRSDHLLQRSTRPIVGTKRGFGHAVLGGFAISAVRVMTDREMLSKRKARKEVAKLLADLGYSLRTGDHGHPKPITDSAIRNWCERPHDYPLHNEIAEAMMPVHIANLARRQNLTSDGVRLYFHDHAQSLLSLSHTF